MAKKLDPQQGMAEDRFCAERLVDRANAVRKALERRRKAGPTADKTEIAAILSDLDDLARSSAKLADALRAPPKRSKASRSKKPMLVLVNPVKVPRKLSIENVLEKLTDQKPG